MGHDERAAEALQAAADDQPVGVGREGDGDGGDGEERHADHEYFASPEAVAQRAGEQQQAAEDDEVGVGDPE